MEIDTLKNMDKSKWNSKESLRNWQKDRKKKKQMQNRESKQKKNKMA